MDWSIIISSLVPYAITAYADIGDSVRQGLILTIFITTHSGFGMYIYPSLFLALDRVFIVLFPLKFRKYVGRLRIVKASLFSVKFTIGIVDSVNEVVFGMNSISNQVLKSMSLILNVFVLLTISALYSIMAVQIVRAGKKMANSKQAGGNGRLVMSYYNLEQVGDV